MGNVFRKIYTREIPASAKIQTKDGKDFACWVGNGDRKHRAEVATLSDGRKVIRMESDTYVAKYRNADDEVVTVATGCRELTNAKQFLAQAERAVERIKAGVADSTELRAAAHKDKRIDDHVAAYLGTFRKSEAYRKDTGRNLRLLMKWLDWKTLADMRRERFQTWLADEKRNGRSARSMNTYHTSLVTFCNWCVETERLNKNPFAKIEKANEKADKRRPKRALSVDEFRRLIDAARTAPLRPALIPSNRRTGRAPELLSGPERAEVYTVLVGTGLRVGELSQVLVKDLHLDDAQPGFDVRAEVDKTRTAAFLPLSRDLVALLRRRIAGRKPGDHVFDIPADLIKRFNGDLKRAGIQKRDPSGLVADIHSLRKTYGTWLAQKGVHPKIAQALMRHKDIKMTMNLYTDLRLLDLAGAVESVSLMHQIMHQNPDSPCPSSPSSPSVSAFRRSS
jgi:integrase